MDLADWLLLYRYQRKKFGIVRGFLRSLRKDLQRSGSRAIFNHYIGPEARGLEVGAGETTLSPVRRTILSDGYSDHAGVPSHAREFFPAEKIPYPDHTFDFLVNEHVLEHLSDPLLALKEWKRVLKPSGILFMTLPHPERTFDRDRPPTPLSHLIQDHENQVDHQEDQHWEEWKAFVLDRGLAPHYQNHSKETSLKENLIHRHVFLPETIGQVMEYSGFKTLKIQDLLKDRNDSFLVVARST